MGTPQAPAARPMFRFINSDGRVFQEQDDGRSRKAPLWAGFDEDILLIVHAEPDGRTFHTVPHPRAAEALALMLDTSLDEREAFARAHAMLSERTPEIERLIAEANARRASTDLDAKLAALVLEARSLGFESAADYIQDAIDGRQVGVDPGVAAQALRVVAARSDEAHRTKPRRAELLRQAADLIDPPAPGPDQATLDLARRTAQNLASVLGVAHEVRGPGGVRERFEPQPAPAPRAVADLSDDEIVDAFARMFGQRGFNADDSEPLNDLAMALARCPEGECADAADALFDRLMDLTPDRICIEPQAGCWLALTPAEWGRRIEAAVATEVGRAQIARRQPDIAGTVARLLEGERGGAPDTGRPPRAEDVDHPDGFPNPGAGFCAGLARQDAAAFEALAPDDPLAEHDRFRRGEG